MITAIIFIAVLAVLILVHELGHFVFAKRAGMKVEEFGFGFPPRLWSVKKGETTYSINWIPFGGFVKILGEDGEARDNPGSFASKPVRSRFMVLVSGVLMNFILAAVLLMLGNTLGLRIGLDSQLNNSNARDIQVQIAHVAKNSPAENAGLQLLDAIEGFKANGATVHLNDVKTIQEYIAINSGREITMLISRGGEVVEKNVTPRLAPPQGEGALGVSLIQTGVVSYPWYEAIWRGLKDSGVLLLNTVYGYWLFLKSIIIQGKLLGDVSGPIGIATLTGQAARIGFNYLIQFVALISMNLAVLNIIPFPALDGGRILLLGIEKIKGRPLSKKIEMAINSIGFALLILLMLYISVKDVARLF